MEWILIFFVLYIFFAVWVMSSALEEIIDILKKIKDSKSR